MNKKKKVKIRVSLNKDMEVYEEDLQFLIEAAHMRDMQAFEEGTELSWEGTPKVQVLGESNE